MIFIVNESGESRESSAWSRMSLQEFFHALHEFKDYTNYKCKNAIHRSGRQKPAKAGSAWVMYGESITRINPDAGLMDCLLVMGKPMFPGNRSDRSERSDRYPLSSGSLLYSGNVRPITKVAVSSNYIPVPFTKGYIEFKGYLSHGIYVI